MVDRTPTETFKKSINTVKVNHVLSTNPYSNIFEAIFKYFMKYSDANRIEHFFSVKPLDNMDIYHYHRPNIESNILKNSFTTVHHDLEDTDSWLDIDKFIAKYRKIDKIICLNETQKLILEKYGLNKTLVIPLGNSSRLSLGLTCESVLIYTFILFLFNISITSLFFFSNLLINSSCIMGP